MIYNKSFKIFLVLTLLIYPMVAFAENIDPKDDDSQYAYSENAGWLNAEPSGDGGPGVEVEDSKLTGYIWGENIGWVSLSCENTSSCGTVDYGVTNDGSGNLSGYAWGENVGWISFSCENTISCATVDYGVIIDPATGEFSGHAWGENIGWTTLCSTGLVSFGITTSWPEDLCECDLNSDGSCNILDWPYFIEDWGSTNCNDPVVDCECDLNGDGSCNILDWPYFIEDWGRTDCP